MNITDHPSQALRKGQGPQRGVIHLSYSNGNGLNGNLIDGEDPLLLSKPTFQYLRKSLEVILHALSQLPQEILECLSLHENPIAIYNAFPPDFDVNTGVTAYYDHLDHCFKMALIQDRGTDENLEGPRHLPLMPNSLVFTTYYAALFTVLHHEYPQLIRYRFPNDTAERISYDKWIRRAQTFKNAFLNAFQMDEIAFGNTPNSAFTPPCIGDPNIQNQLEHMACSMLAHFLCDYDQEKTELFKHKFPNSYLCAIDFMESLDSLSLNPQKILVVLNGGAKIFCIPPAPSTLLKTETPPHPIMR